MKSLSQRQAIFIVFAAIFVYVAVIGSVSLLRHNNFQTQAWDMGIFTQTLWNASQGRGMVNSIEEIPNHFGVHMSPILYLLLPGFLIFPSVYYLLIIQALALALGAWPLYLFAGKILERRDFALIFAVGYLFYPALHWVNLFDFHPVAFLVPALLASFYFFSEARRVWFWIFTAIAASSQEDAVLAVIFVGLFLAVINRRENKNRNMALCAALAALAYFIISIKIIMPYFGGGLLRIDRYAGLGGSAFEIAQNLFLNPLLFLKTAFGASKLAYFFWLFLPVAFLPFAHMPALLLLIPGLLENLLTAFQNQFSGFYQYDSMLIAGIFTAGVYGFKSILQRWPDREPLLKWALICAIFIGFLFRSPVSPIYFPAELFKSGERRQILSDIVKNIPAGVSVSAHTNIIPHLANRERLYMLGMEPFWYDQKLFKPDAVIVDGGDLFGFYTPEALQNYADSYAESGLYNIQVIKDRYIIFTKKNLSFESER